MSASQGFMGRMFTGFLNTVLSSENKRIIFLSSLTAFLRDTSDPDRQTLERLNEIFRLSSQPDALRFPMIAQKRIWKAIDIKDIQVPGITVGNECVDGKRPPVAQLRILANQVLDQCPDWLRYGSKSQMRKEVISLLSKMDQIHSQPTAH